MVNKSWNFLDNANIISYNTNIISSKEDNHEYTLFANQRWHYRL